MFRNLSWVLVTLVKTDHPLQEAD